MRYFLVFNLDQVDGLNPDKLPVDSVPDTGETKLDFEPIEYCEKIITDMPNRPKITHSEQRRAFYRPASDEVHLPNKQHFENESLYYAVAFHELAHSTGHESRLNRQGDKIAAFGGNNYAKEELIAEMAAAMLCGVTGIENQTIENSASYIENWRTAISKDKKLVIQAASAGQKAANYIQDLN